MTSFNTEQVNELQIAFQVSDYTFRLETTPKYINSRNGDKSLTTGWVARAFPVILEKTQLLCGGGAAPLTPKDALGKGPGTLALTRVRPFCRQIVLTHILPVAAFTLHQR